MYHWFMPPLTPSRMYRILNRRIWLNRLPAAKIVFVKNSHIPRLAAITLHDGEGLFAKPVICVNLKQKKNKHWALALIHEMVHVAEPELQHGRIFNALVRQYWFMTQKHLNLFPKKDSHV